MSSSSINTVVDRLPSPEDTQALQTLATELSNEYPTSADSLVQCLRASFQAIAEGSTSSSATTKDTKLLSLWLVVDKLLKLRAGLRDALQPHLIHWGTTYAPSRNDDDDHAPSSAFSIFRMVLDSLRLFFGPQMVRVIELKLHIPDDTTRRGGNPHAASGQVALRPSVSSIGAFGTKLTNSGREPGVTTLQVRTVDSLMSMSVSSAYAPLRPVEIAAPMVHRDADAPRGHMQALPEGYVEQFQAQRRKRLREVMEKNREEEERRANAQLMQQVAGGGRGVTTATAAAQVTVAYDDFSDVQMPEELPRDEYGVKKANFPLGVRFLKNAIAACGGAVELDVLTQRISTLASKDVVREFGDVREFLMIHKPTFTVDVEEGIIVVRLRDGPVTPLQTSCPFCSRNLRSRNLAKHVHCRRCVAVQVALGLRDQITGPISELSHVAKWFLDHPSEFDDDDLRWFADTLNRAADTPRYKLSSPTKFLPVLKAIRVVRSRWLRQKQCQEMAEIVLDTADLSFVSFFATLGANIHRLPIPWIESGDVVDMCMRFTNGVKRPHLPPPRPADPRISLHNDYPGLLFCESEIDSEDDPSEAEQQYSDDESEAFTFAPPVTVMETLMAAGFERDTKLLNHRLRTAPPLVLTRVLQGDRGRTVVEAYSSQAKAF